MAINIAIKDVDKGWKQLRKDIEALGGAEVKSGLVGEAAQAKYPNGATVAQVGLAHEFGDGNLPERSFIRATFDANLPKYNALLIKLGQAVHMGRAATRSVLDLLGSTMASDMKARIRAGVSPALAAATIARKSKLGRKDPALPLVDTRKLINAITHLVVFNKRGDAAEKAA